MRSFRRLKPVRSLRRIRPGLRPVRLRLGWLRWVVLGLAVLYLLVRIGDLLLFQPLKAVAEVEARRLGAVAVNRVMAEQVGRSLGDAAIVEYEKDADGRVAAYRINTPLVNRVTGEAAVAVQEELKRLAEKPVSLPVGALTGSALLSNLGPHISVQLVPVGSVAIDVRQEFRSEGINQSRHRIWLHASAKMRMILPLMTEEVAVVQEFPLSDTVIVGPVPNSLYGGNLGGVTIPGER